MSSSCEDDNSREHICKRLKHDGEKNFNLLNNQSSSGRASGGADAAFSNIPSTKSENDMQLVDSIEIEDEDQSGSEQDIDSLYDSEVPEEEIDALLEESLPDEMKGARNKRKKPEGEQDENDTPFERKEKLILVEKNVNHFEVLPEGWVEVTHNSGMPVYLHKESRVCTFSRPYFLGTGSVRKHKVPLSAIPCLKYLRDLQDEEKTTHIEEKELETDPNKSDNNSSLEEENSASNENGVKLPSSGPLAAALFAQSPLPPSSTDAAPNDPDVTSALSMTRVESVNDVQEKCSVEPQEVHEYCKSRFEFKKMKILRFKTWGDKRRYEKAVNSRNRPQLPDGTKLISLKRQDVVAGLKKEWVMNPKGKSYVCILHEYVQHVLKNQPKYDFREVDNAATPYSATVTINDVLYGSGYGSSKKLAKTEAAKATLEILLPELGKKIRLESKKEDSDLSFFDEIRVEDPRVPDLCNKTSELSPYAILLNCLQRNFGLSGANIEYKLSTQKNQKNEFSMTVGKHSVQIFCRNKKDGKQRASQGILQKLHPHISSWGSLLRLYGNRSLQPIKERKAEEQEVTLLQANATLHQPNTSIINKLREEMLKLKHMKKEIQPIGKFLPPEDICPPTAPGSDLNNVDL